jgi:hypothetical protein
VAIDGNLGHAGAPPPRPLARQTRQAGGAAPTARRRGHTWWARSLGSSVVSVCGCWRPRVGSMQSD